MRTDNSEPSQEALHPEEQFQALLDAIDAVPPDFFTKLQEKLPFVINNIESRICLLIRVGLTMREIADCTCVSEQSVVKRVTTIRRKMNLKNLRELRKELVEIK